MEQSSTSKVTGNKPSILFRRQRPVLARATLLIDLPAVEFFDPHDVYKLAAPGLIPRLPSATSTGNLVVSGEEIDPSQVDAAASRRSASVSTTLDGFQTQAVSGGPTASASADAFESPSASSTQLPQAKARRHQIPGLRRTPYLKVLLVRCDDSDSYKSQSSSKKTSFEGHDAFDWMVVHVVLPNTVAATQPRTSGKGSDTSSESKSSSRWRGGSSTLMEKLQADFNIAGKNQVDRVAQVRTEQDVEFAWQDLVGKLKARILNSFDMRVSRYEEDIKEKDSQRILPGWNFCTFFILKEGLARGFESVGLVEDALVGYDELSVGLDLVIAEQATSGEPESHGGALLPYTQDLKDAIERALALIKSSAGETGDLTTVNLQANDAGSRADGFEDIPIMASKKPYRDMILANNVSLFDFKCYIFARQISLLLRLGNASSTREELVAKLNEQRESVLRGVDPRIPPMAKHVSETENLSRLSEVCRRTLEFIPVASQIMQQDIIAAMQSSRRASDDAEAAAPKKLPPSLSRVVDHAVASFAFSVAQQVLAQTTTKALPIPPSTLATPDGHEPKLSIPEPKTMMHPARTSSLAMAPGSRPPPSPNVFPGPGRSNSVSEPGSSGTAHFLKAGLEELAARRAELYSLCRNVLEKLGRAKGWRDGWSEVPTLPDSIDYSKLEDVSLNDEEEDEDDDDDDDDDPSSRSGGSEESSSEGEKMVWSTTLGDRLLNTALSSKEDFYRLYETLTDKALRHYTVANHTHSIQSCMADLAVLKYQAGEFSDAAIYFHRATPFFGENGWSLLELSMLTMYCRCLKTLEWKEKLVQAILKLLMGAAAAEAEFAEQRSLAKFAAGRPDLSAIKGFVAELLASSKSLPEEVIIPLSNFFLDVDVCSAPVYLDGDAAVGVRGWGPTKEVRLESAGKQVVKPKKSRLTFYGKAVVTGRFKVDQLILENGRLVLSYERDVNQITPMGETIFKNPPILLYAQTRSLNIRLAVAKQTRLDQNNALEIEISTGWNAIKSCELSLKPATGGLRTIAAEAKVRDVASVTLRIEATYATADGGVFTCVKLASAPIALALGVNVQDVFKHHALYSRFTVSTASTGPLRLFKSELVDSEIFESHFGVPPAAPVLVFPKQPATLLYKITRKKKAVRIGPGGTKSSTMYLKLHYSELTEEVDTLLRTTLVEALEGSDAVGRFVRLLVPTVIRHAHEAITAHDLERAALTGRVSTGFVAQINWRRELEGLDQNGAAKTGAVTDVVAFFEAWLRKNKTLQLGSTAAAVDPSSSSSGSRSLVIPVDIPPVPVLVTADIELKGELPFTAQQERGDPPTACVNQLIPAVLRLRWTRMWDTAARAKPGAVGDAAAAAGGDRAR
ncbi:unnamed protein product [Parascedosporium putredinis]|uniref:TMEM1 family protein n=1 Tax=Parascedosporium putredinis TaxID=1442378 RepID=A0A9P1MBZ0_9PEZI|nr:unnamed protein product [Parascedosporium putredinis]CAI7997387.1 unnamed protein product [Parascedosporium putredinis]